MTPNSSDRPSPTPQLIATPSTRAAIFLVVTLRPDEPASAAVRSMCADLPALLRSAGFRDLGGHLTCVVGFASEVWDRLFGNPRPAELHPFREFHAENRHAIATPGDVLFHVRAERMDLCFELASLIMTALGDAVAVADEVQGFQYFDNRDLLGFVDGTENPEGQAADDAVLIGGEDPAFAGGSYVVLQKYLHDLAAWNALPTEMQERIIGRTKLANTDLDPAVKPSSAHNALTIIVENGVEVKIVRCNMPFGQPGQGEDDADDGLDGRGRGDRLSVETQRQRHGARRKGELDLPRAHVALRGVRGAGRIAHGQVDAIPDVGGSFSTIGNDERSAGRARDRQNVRMGVGIMMEVDPPGKRGRPQRLLRV
jgi:putative iron-dependent peroxidase